MIGIASMACAETVKEAEARFEKAQDAYIAAKEEIRDAKLDSLLTFGKEEKKKAVDRIHQARRELKTTRKTYKDALKALRQAEMVRDAKRDRSPWR